MTLTRSFVWFPLALFVCGLGLTLSAQTAGNTPKIIERDGRHALVVDGAPYLVLGAQINNSSTWPDVLPQVWPALEAMHVNTAEAPVYWEQIEPQPGRFDWSSVDAVLDGARAHHLRLVLLWFGTWKNGNDHYVPDWVKRDPQHYPRVINSYGTPLDVLSANSQANMEADRRAFTALMHHLAERDAQQHTILMVQVENESGIVGAVRDYSPEAEREFRGRVPENLTRALGKKSGMWSEVFGGSADEAFEAWTQARYIEEIAKAGKREFPIPLYCNVWLAYPPAELPERHISIPGIGYPSGGPVQTILPIWKAAAPSVDVIGPDIYNSDVSFYLSVLDTYSRPDNALWIPETGSGDAFAPFFFAALGRGAIGFSPFGIDWTGWNLRKSSVPKAHAENYELLGPMNRTIAKLNFAGAVQTAIEVAGGSEQELVFAGDASRNTHRDALVPAVSLTNATVPLGEAGTAASRAADTAGTWIAEVRFGFPRDGQHAPGTTDHSGRMLVAQLGRDEFLITGVGGSVRFHRPGLLSGIRMQILRAEEGYYTPSSEPGAAEVWHMTRLLNGDQDDRGIQFPEFEKQGPTAVRITLGRF